MNRHIVIIGNGISGITAARFIRKMSDERVTVISDETDFFFSRTALMYIYMGHMRYEDTKPYENWFWPKNRIDTIRDYVDDVDLDRKRLALRRGGSIDYDVLLFATGSTSNTFGWPGENLQGVQCLYGVPDLEKMERNTQAVDRAVVVGGGLIGIEMVEMLHSRHIPVTFLVRESGYMDYAMPPPESAMIVDEILRHGIDLRLNSRLSEIRGDNAGRVRSVLTDDGQEIPCEFVGLTVGVRPNAGLAGKAGLETNRGILVNGYFETGIPDVYAVGDCVEFREDGIGSARIEQLWYTGRAHGKTVAATICGVRTAYDPGPFFNSAKFFTIEWQTYGRIHAVRPAGIDSLVWSDPRRRQLLRVDFEASSRRVVGFNALGIRLRHEICDRWLREGQSVDVVVDQLGRANFNPEFERRYEQRVSEALASRREVQSYA